MVVSVSDFFMVWKWMSNQIRTFIKPHGQICFPSAPLETDIPRDKLGYHFCKTLRQRLVLSSELVEATLRLAKSGENGDRNKRDL